MLKKNAKLSGKSEISKPISDAIIQGNTNGLNGGGILLKPSGAGKVIANLTRVQCNLNTFGLRVEGDSVVSARDSSFSGNNTEGVVAAGSALSFVNLDNCTMSKNTNSGLRAAAGATIRYGKCMIVNNTTGLDTAGATGFLVSFGNNSVAGNPTPGAPTSTPGLQ